MQIRATLAASIAWGFLLGSTPAEASDVSQPLSVVFVNPGKRGEVFWDMVTGTMAAAGRKLGISVETLYAERNRREMQELGFAVTRRVRKPDFLVLVNEEAAAAPILEAAEVSGVKTFLLSNTLTDEDARQYGPPRTALRTWIGSIEPDMDVAGARMANAIIAKAREGDLRSADGKIHILAIGGDEITPTSIARNKGLEQAIAAAPDAVVDRLLFANWNATEAEVITTNYLAWARRKGIRVAGIWAGNDPMALGALQASTKANLQPGKDLFITGLNWSPDALKAVDDGRMLLTDGGHFLMGGWTMVLLRDYADGCDFAKRSANVAFPTSSMGKDAAPILRELIRKGSFDRMDFTLLRAKKPDRCGEYDFSVDALLRVTEAGSGE